eukprot:jgi/Tetstr1/464182/TSEL_008987.t1
MQAVVCWPGCSDEVRENVREWVRANGARREEHAVAIKKREHLDSLLVQAYARRLIDIHCDEETFSKKRSSVSGNDKASKAKGEAVCFSFHSAQTMTRDHVSSTPNETFIAESPEEADRVARSFAKPMLTYDGFRSPETCKMLSQLMGIRQANVKAQVGDSLFYGDVAMLCYGLRSARKGEVEAILLDGEMTGKQRRQLEKSGIRASTVEEWRRNNDVLINYHGVNMASVAESNHVCFMGLMIPPAAVSLDISRARTGGSASVTQLLDSMLIKSLIGTKQPLPCVFGDLSPDPSLTYSPRLTSLVAAYVESRDEVKAAQCADGESPDLGFDVRTPEVDAKKEVEQARSVHAKVKGMPVIPMHYGIVKCGSGDHRVAVEAFDMTLETWMLKARTSMDWLEVLSRTVWCAAALDRVAGMNHAGLGASHVLVRGTEGRGQRRAAPVRLNGVPMPHGDWDVRLSRIDLIVPGRENGTLQGLARQILESVADSDLPVDIRTALQTMQNTTLSDTVKEFAGRLKTARVSNRKKSA